MPLANAKDSVACATSVVTPDGIKGSVTDTELNTSKLSIFSLLVGAALLFLAGGINSLLLPLRGTAEGMSTLTLGLLGTGWAVGYVLGCLRVPVIVARVGHIRSFSLMSALASLSILGSAMLMDPTVWIILRAVAGFAFAGAAMIIESWLAEASNSQNRGRVFGIYTMVLLGAGTAGQLVLPLADTLTMFFFIVTAMLYSLSLIPTAISSSRAPQPLLRTQIDLSGLWRNSPLAVAGAFIVGLANSAFLTLGAVYAAENEFPLTTITLFVSMPILAGAITQLPIGWLSDHFDRRWVLTGSALLAVIVDATFVLTPATSPGGAIAMASIFGIAIYAMYPVLVAHANDHANPEDAMLTSSAILMVFGVGSIIGPAVAGVLMGVIGSKGMFVTTLFAHTLLGAYAVWRTTRRQGVVQEDKDPFNALAPSNSITPQTTAYIINADSSLVQEGIEIDDLAEPAMTHTHTSEIAQGRTDNDKSGNDEQHWSQVV